MTTRARTGPGSFVGGSMRGSQRLAGGIIAALVLCLSAQTVALAAPSAPSGYDSSYAGESVFTAIGAGGAGQMSAIFFNSGAQPWPPGGVGLLARLPYQPAGRGA